MMKIQLTIITHKKIRLPDAHWPRTQFEQEITQKVIRSTYKNWFKVKT